MLNQYKARARMWIEVNYMMKKRESAIKNENWKELDYATIKLIATMDFAQRIGIIEYKKAWKWQDKNLYI